MDKNEQAKVEIVAVQGTSRVKFRRGDDLVMEVIADKAGYEALVERMDRLRKKIGAIGVPVAKLIREGRRR